MHAAGAVAAPRLPDQPVVPVVFMAPLGDQGRVVPAPSPPNSSDTPPPTQDTSATIPGAAICSQDSAIDQDGYDDYSIDHPVSSVTWRPDKCRILLLCGGPDDRPDSLFNLFTAVEGFECINYDVANGPQFDIVDDLVWDTIYTAVTSLEYF